MSKDNGDALTEEERAQLQQLTPQPINAPILEAGRVVMGQPESTEPDENGVRTVTYRLTILPE